MSAGTFSEYKIYYTTETRTRVTIPSGQPQKVTLCYTCDMSHFFSGRIAGDVVFGVVWVLFVLFLFSILIRRCHDLGWSGWHSLLMLIPFVNIVIGLMLLLKPGQQEPNEYGAMPPTTNDIQGTLFPK